MCPLCHKAATKSQLKGWGVCESCVKIQQEENKNLSAKELWDKIENEGGTLQPKNERRVLVTGDRNYKDYNAVKETLAKLQDQGFTAVIEGEARGADTLAREAAKELGMRVIALPAKWDKYGMAAGPKRNAEMLTYDPELVVAFHDDLDNSKGTRDMVVKSRAKGLEVRLVLHDDGSPPQTLSL